MAVTSWSARSTIRLQSELARRQAEESHRQQREDQLAELVGRYRDPLLLAAFDLQSRLYNIVRNNFLAYLRAGAEEDDRDYARSNTLFLFAQFFGWTEALRVDVQFLDLGDLDRSRRLRECLDAVRAVLATDRLPDQRLRVFWGRQRAIGELMLRDRSGERGAAVPRECIGYAAFSRRLNTDDDLASWLRRLGEDLGSLADDREFNPIRLVQTQHALIELIDFLDDPPVRFPVHLRTKV